MTSFFLPKTISPPGAVSPSSHPDDSRSPLLLNTEPLQPQPQPAAPPIPKSPLLPREVLIPQPVLPVIHDLYLRRRRVEEITSLPTPTLYRYMKHGLFPRPHKLGPNRVGWPASSVLAWLNSRTAA